MPIPTSRRVVAGAGASAVLFISLSIAAAPVASSHAGGRAQLYIERLKVQPGPAGWAVQVTLTDADSGQPEPGFAVSVSGSGPSGASFGPTDLADPANDGRYSGAVRATPGPWTIFVNAHDVPGGPAAVAVSRRYDVMLAPGQASDGGSSSATLPAARHSSRLSGPRLLAGVVLTGAFVVVAVRLARNRRRTATVRDGHRRSPPLDSTLGR
jgi:hypothetical protein